MLKHLSQRKGEAKYRHITGFDIQPKGRSGKPSGEPVEVPLPKIETPERKRKKKNYYTFFEFRNNGKLRFQRHLISGQAGVNWTIKKEFTYYVPDENEMLKNLAFSIMSILPNVRIRLEGAQRLIELPNSVAIPLEFILNDYKEQYKSARRRHIASLRRRHRKP